MSDPVCDHCHEESDYDLNETFCGKHKLCMECVTTFQGFGCDLCKKDEPKEAPKPKKAPKPEESSSDEDGFQVSTGVGRAETKPKKTEVFLVEEKNDDGEEIVATKLQGTLDDSTKKDAIKTIQRHKRGKKLDDMDIRQVKDINNYIFIGTQFKLIGYHMEEQSLWQMVEKSGKMARQKHTDYRTNIFENSTLTPFHMETNKILQVGGVSQQDKPQDLNEDIETWQLEFFLNANADWIELRGIKRVYTLNIHGNDFEHQREFDLHDKRHSHTTTNLWDGDVVNEDVFVCVGGQHGDYSNESVLASVEVYRKSAGGEFVWTQVEPLSEAKTLHSAVSIGWKLYVFGGQNKIGGNWEFPKVNVEMLDCSDKSNKWTPINLEGPTARIGMCISKSEGSILLLGGSDSKYQVQNTLYKLTPDGDTTLTSTTLASAPNGISQGHFYQSSSGTFHCIGGFPHSNFLSYNIADDKWTETDSDTLSRLNERIQLFFYDQVDKIYTEKQYASSHFFFKPSFSYQ